MARRASTTRWTLPTTGPCRSLRRWRTSSRSSQHSSSRCGNAAAEGSAEPPQDLARRPEVARAPRRADVVAVRDARTPRRLRLPGGRARSWPALDHPAAARHHRHLRAAARLLPDQAARRPSRGDRRHRDRHRARPLRVLRRPGRRERRAPRTASGRSRSASSSWSPWFCSCSAGAAASRVTAAAYGTVAGMLFGLSAALTPSTLDYLHESVGTMLSHWECYALAVAGVGGFVIQQVSLGTGRLAPPWRRSPSRTRSSASRSGSLLLDETLSRPTWHIVVAVIGLGARAGRRRRDLARARGGEGERRHDPMAGRRGRVR